METYPYKKLKVNYDTVLFKWKSDVSFLKSWTQWRSTRDVAVSV